MGRQIRYYMLPEDDQNFIRFVKSMPGAFFCRGTFSTREDMILEPEGTNPINFRDAGLVIAFDQWGIQDKFIKKGKYVVPPYSDFYYVDKGKGFLIEFDRCFINPEGKLNQGRLWVEMNSLVGNRYIYKGDDFKRNFEQIIRWIRRNFKKVDGLDGYFGLEAERAYLKGELKLYPGW